MTPALTAEQVQALAARPDEPMRMIDPQSNESYILVRPDEYDRLRDLAKDDYSLRDTYAAQLRSAMRAGWDNPAMDDYDNYDACLKAALQLP